MADKRIIELEERLTLSDGDYFATDNTNGTCKVNAKILLDRLSDNEDAIATKAAKVDLTNISITGSTNNTGSTITSGSFFYKDGTLVRAKTDIANNATLTLNTNYEIVTAGGLNALNNALTQNVTVDAVDANKVYLTFDVLYTAPTDGILTIACYESGKYTQCAICGSDGTASSNMRVDGTNTQQNSFYVKKGTKLKYNAYTGSTSNRNNKVYFSKLLSY